MRYTNSAVLTWWGSRPYDEFMFWLKVKKGVQVLDQRNFTTATGTQEIFTVLVDDTLRIEAHITDQTEVRLNIFWNGRHPIDIGINGFRPKFVSGISPWGYPWDTTIESNESLELPSKYKKEWFILGLVGVIVIATMLLGFVAINHVK